MDADVDGSNEGVGEIEMGDFGERVPSIDLPS
eukprot:CAMPEP_0175111992 /NCGR_PEP_ID=MMETSP0086_2-20121207/15168_1 /TAXON_ID=136419 /ORGANISM="Unknown Unknown, Strain D1" /LENGTH=31 /DNA_ID= /DNA_START= /DNA_END= /DNA_ORIENTATION=